MSRGGKTDRTSRPRRLFATALGALLLAELALLANFIFAYSPTILAASSVVDALGVDAAQAIEHPSISTFNDVTRRPLFEIDRRQIVRRVLQGADPTLTQKFANDWRLTGVAIGEERSVAILENSRSGEVMSLATGDTHDGWAIDRIDSNGVIIRSGATSREFVLDDSVRPDVAIAKRNGVLVRTH